MLQRRPWFAVALALGVLPLTGCAGIPRPSFVQSLLPETREKSLQKMDAQLSLARLSERNGDKQTAEQIYQSVLKKYPPNQMVHHRLGVLAAEKTHFEEAASHFDTAAQLGPPSSELVNDIGYNLYLMGRRPEAEAAFRRALELNPENKSARINLAMLLGEASRFEESLAEFRRAGTEAEAQVNLAYVKAQAGDLDGAAACYHRALTLDKDLKPAAEALIQLTRYQAELKAKSPARPQAPAIRSRFADSGPDLAATEGISTERADSDTQAKASRLIDSVSLGEPRSGRQQPRRGNDAGHRQVAYVSDKSPSGGSAGNRPVPTPASSGAPPTTPDAAEVIRHHRLPRPAETGTSGPQRGPAGTSGAVPCGETSAVNPGSPGPQVPASRGAFSGEATFGAANPQLPNPVPMAMNLPWQRPTWSPELKATLPRDPNDPTSSADGQNAPAGPDVIRASPWLDGSALPVSPNRENPLLR